MIDKSEIQEKVRNYLSNPTRIASSNERIIDFIFQTPFEALVVELEKLPPTSVYNIFKNKLDDVKNAIDLDFVSAFPFASFAEGMEKETENAIADFVYSIEVKPSMKLLVDLMKQKTVQDLIASIIESGIIEFNKKTNPFFGMIQATGLDKQIKSFINLFLPNFLPKIADFLYSTTLGENSTLSKDISLLVMNAPFAEFQLPNDIQIAIAEEKLKSLQDRFSQDKKLESTLMGFGSKIQNRFLAKFGKDTLISFLKISDAEFNPFKATLSAYIAEEIKTYHAKNPIDNLLAELISDILIVE